MKRNKVSIITSVYNGELYISEAIESVLAQSISDWELLIMDDCSTDDTVNIINSYKDERIILKQNDVQKGKTVNRNELIKNAKGEYIAILDADDIYMENHLECTCDYLDRHRSIDIVCTYATAIGAKTGLLTTINDYEKLKASTLFTNTMIHSTVVFRRENCSFYDESFPKSEDYELWERLMHEGKRIHVIPKSTIKYRYHHKQVSTASKASQLAQADRVRVRALTRLGVELPKQENDIFLNFVNYHLVELPSDYAILLKVLFLIVNNNKSRKLYSRTALLYHCRPYLYEVESGINKSMNIELNAKVNMWKLIGMRYHCRQFIKRMLMAIKLVERER